MSIRKRIIEYLDFKNISKYRFYQEIGVSNGFLDKEGSIGSEKCEKISEHYPDISLVWLLTGKGSMIRPDFLSPENENENTAKEPPANSATAPDKASEGARIDTLIQNNCALNEANIKLAQTAQDAVKASQDAIKMASDAIAGNQRQAEENQRIMARLMMILENSKKHLSLI